MLVDVGSVVCFAMLRPTSFDSVQQEEQQKLLVDRGQIGANLELRLWKLREGTFGAFIPGC